MAHARNSSSLVSHYDQLGGKWENAMSDLNGLMKDLVIANRVLAREEVIDAYGHVSVRHPNNPVRF